MLTRKARRYSAEASRIPSRSETPSTSTGALPLLALSHVPTDVFRHPPRKARLAAALTLVLALSGMTAGQASASGDAPAARTQFGVDINAAGCGRTWKAPRSGATTFTVHNETGTTDDVTLTSAASRVYAEIPTLGPGVIRPLRVVLEPGKYSWKCVSTDGSFSFSPVELVRGHRVADPSPAYEPVDPNDLEAAATAYRDWAAEGLAGVASDVDTLQRAVDEGNLPAAEQDWLTADLAYERLGAVYDAFGNFNDEINGRADGLQGGVADPHFTGFLRLEYGLWHHQPQATLIEVAKTLDTDVHGLVKAFPSQLVLVTDVPLRAHEIIENALQFELTGDTDEGSHTNLATVRANIDGDRQVLTVLQTLIDQRDPKLLKRAEAQLTTFANLLDTYRSPAGEWTPVETLTLDQHERLDADADAALATLDQIPAILEQASGDSS